MLQAQQQEPQRLTSPPGVTGPVQRSQGPRPYLLSLPTAHGQRGTNPGDQEEEDRPRWTEGEEQGPGP